MNPSSSSTHDDHHHHSFQFKQQTYKSNKSTGRRRWSLWWYYVWWSYEDDDMIWYHTISIMMVVVPPTNWDSFFLFILLSKIHAIHSFGCLQAGQCWTGILYVLLNKVKQSNIHKNNSFGSLSQSQNTYVCIRHISLQTVPDYKRKSFFLSLSMRSTSRSGHFWKKK